MTQTVAHFWSSYRIYIILFPSEMSQHRVFRKTRAFAIYFKALACQNTKSKEVIDWTTMITGISAHLLQKLSSPCPKIVSVKHSQTR